MMQRCRCKRFHGGKLLKQYYPALARLRRENIPGLLLPMDHMDGAKGVAPSLMGDMLWL
jgi:hypothetical protein